MRHNFKLWLPVIPKDVHKILAVISLLYLTSCSEQPGKNSALNFKAETGNYNWTQLSDNAAFPKGYNFQMFSIRDTLWVLHHAGTWFSLNGREWVKSPLTNILKNNGFLDYVWFNNALYSLGSFDGNIEKYTLTTQVAQTTDFRSWQILSANSNLPKRFFYHPFVFKNKIWIIGGTDGKNNFSDAWTSDDAVNWIKVADNLPFGANPGWNGQQFVVFKDRIYRVDNDVWVSSNGLHWEKITGKISNETIFGYSPIVYDGKIWLIGCNRDGKFSSEVIYSADGKHWNAVKAPWTPRGGATTCIFKGKVFMTGGKYGGFTKDGRTTEFVYSNDVWTLEKENNYR
jgi:hypothetical protein